MSLAKIKQGAKSVTALIGSIVVGLLAVYGPETPVGQVLTVIAVLATAVGVWATPNTPQRDQGNQDTEGTFHTQH